MSALATVTPLKQTARPVWLSPEQVVERIPGMTVANLQELRKTGKGPAFYKPTGPHGKVTLYDAAEVDAWVLRSRNKTREQQ